jgi:two-component system response regulator MprA
MVSRKRILIVEDEEDLVQVLRQRLQFEGYEVVTASNGRDGLDLLAKGGIDMIVLDMMLPVMDGFAFLEASVGGCDHGSPLPVVVITAYGTKFTAEQWQLLKGCSVVNKPFEPEDLLKKLKDLLS